MSTATATPELQASHRKDPRTVHYWTAKDMPPQDGKTFVVTGASSGMGYACAENLAKKGGHVIIASRSLERSEKAADMIKNTGARGQVEAMHLDLTSFQSIVDFANEYKKRDLPLHVLIENAGVFLVPHDRTQEGFETTLGTNYFGHFLLAHLLLDKLKETAKTAEGVRIVAMASLFELLGSVRWDDLEGYKRKDSSLFEYSDSKVMVIMMARELNKRLKGSNVEAFISQPGLVQTPLNARKLDHSKLVAISVDLATKVYGQNAARAALCLQRPATDPNVTGYGGSYFSPPWLWLLALQTDNAGMREPGNSLARDEIAWNHLYKQTLQIVNQKLAEKGLGQIEAAEKI
jgi:NAD(P)-dependent dehydrogenase (short-subunit alcohol dehydrogenase family)